ncbi:replicative DNA helicase [Pseudogracilibacillus auburnensis]|uniref:replicative DNA helicase n=1 Tax=Pseudogracilibacillus auburnensis TaxID=1494959 RepID=UPI001A95AF19|nr:DnaB-like helicase C-terminal domain-containing protein [Pseudogracilibacillus auburnensis]MBO1003143.1 AAA family ATPase [Pseudogracilibacillus auburnensis]
MTSTGTDLAAEQSVLGAVFLDPNVLDDIHFLEDRDFLDQRHQQIYRVMRWLDQKNKPVDLTTVTELYVQHNRADQVSVVYLTDMATSVPTTANVRHYADIVRSKAIRRRGAEIGKEISALSREDFESDDEYFSAVESLVSDMRPEDEGRMKNFSETRKNYFNHLLSKEIEYVETGFPKFDGWAHGLWRGWLFVSAGRPSVGKTALLLQRVMGVAESGPVLVWSQEMDENQLKDRMISNLSGIPYNRIKNKELNPQQYGFVEEAYNRLEKLPIYIQDSSGVTIDEVRSTARRFKRRYGDLAMIAVDYLQIMNIPRKRGETRAESIGNVTQAAKQIARDMRCCFMMLSQMNRDSDKQAKKPNLSHLKESSSIEQDADVVEFLWHDPNDYEQQGKVIQQFIAKGRDIGINEFRLLFRGWKQHFEELK